VHNYISAPFNSILPDALYIIAAKLMRFVHVSLLRCTAASASSSLPFFRPFFSATCVKQDMTATEIKSHNQYKTDGFDKSDLHPSAFAQFRAWFDEASGHVDVKEPEAMTISTTALVQHQGKTIARPSSRVVLLKRVDDRGFVFFSNYESRKGGELRNNPFIALTFYWYALHRSVRVCGRVERLSQAENDEYFNSRPLGSRIGAIASPQSQPIEDRATLEMRVHNVEEQHGVPGAAGLADDKGTGQTHEDRHVDVPPYWGGYRVIPDEVEFWMGRQNRLHDRFR
jgi:pyridoxamine-phosphate oxidase